MRSDNNNGWNWLEWLHKKSESEVIVTELLLLDLITSVRERHKNFFLVGFYPFIPIYSVKWAEF